MKLKNSASDRAWPTSFNYTVSKERRASSKNSHWWNRRTLSLAATFVSFAALLIGASHSGVTHADPLPVVDESGTISSSETWTAGNVYYVESAVSVASGVTLTINPGAIVKFATGYGYNFIFVDSGGTLDAAGTSTNPVIFTSAEDDSQGGDTTGDGATSGSPGDYTSAIYPYGGTVDVSYADFEYGTQDIGDYPGNNNSSTVTVTDSTFSNSEEGVVQNSDSSLSLQRNSFASSNTGYPISVTSMDVSGIDLHGTNANTFSGSGKNIAVDVEGYSSVGSGNTWSVGGGPVVYIGGQPLSVSGTVDLYAGTVVKTTSSSVGLDVYSGGALNATGTSSTPVIFTSYKDDSVGGDTNGDSSSSGSAGDYYGAIAPQGGNVDVTYADFNYASNAMYDYPSNDSGSNVTVTNSTFTDDQEGVVQNSDSSLTLQSNSFVDNTNYPISVYSVDVSGIALSGSDANTFTGTGRGIVVEVNGYSSVGSDKTWTIGSGPIVLIDGQPIGVSGTVDLGTGAIVKMSNSDTGFDVYSGATLDASGVSGNPVVFTSYEDDSVGGDSTGDGVTSGSHGNYTAAVDPVGGTVDISYADLSYASAALYDSVWPDNSGSTVTVTNSSFTDDTQGVVQKSDSSLTLQSNSFGDNTSYPISVYTVDVSGIALSGADANTFSGSGPGVAIEVNGYSSVGSGETWTVDSEQVLYMDGQPLNVSGTVDLDAGAVVKMSGNTGFQIDSGATLDASGTSTNPVVFTSSKDDSVGGDSNGDGSSSGSHGDYMAVIDPVGGTVDVTYANFNYASAALDDSVYPNNSGSNVTVTNSSFTDDNQGVVQNDDSSLTLQSNEFTDNSSYPIYIYSVDPSGIALSGVDANTFSGSGPGTVIYVQGYSSVGTGETWTVNSGQVLYLDSTIDVYGTVNLDAGAVVKLLGSGSGFDVQSGGVLNATGNSASPVVFTSFKDDSIGGDSNGDGSSTGSPGDYGEAVRFEEPDSSDVVSYVVFKYATDAISIGTLGTINVDHAQFSDNQGAFLADTTSTDNPVLQSLSGACAWPYANSINVTHSWFGAGSGSGYPGNSIDVSGYLGELVPDAEDYPGLSELYGDFTSLEPFTIDSGDNTIPWTVFTCDIPDTDLGISFPVTPVNLSGDSFATEQLWTDADLAE